MFFGPILPKFEENFKIGVDEIGGCSILPVRKTVVPWWYNGGTMVVGGAMVVMVVVVVNKGGVKG